MSPDDLDRLAVLAERANDHPAWTTYGAYLALRGQGLRPAAMSQLDRFVADALTWTFENRLAFTTWLLDASRGYWNSALPLPQPLETRLIVPTVREWRDLAPTAPGPHLWLGLLGCDDPAAHLERALELDPACERARQALVEGALGDIAFNQHHLPSFYIGDAVADLAALDDVVRRVVGGASEGWTKDALQEINELRSGAKAWLESRP